MKKALAIFAITAVLAIMGLAIHSVVKAKRAAREVQEESALRGLAVETADALGTYYKSNDSYPEKLQELPTNLLKFHDGSSPAMFQRFRYTSDGRSYEFVWDSKWASQVSCTGSSAAVWVPLFPTNPPSYD